MSMNDTRALDDASDALSDDQTKASKAKVEVDRERCRHRHTDAMLASHWLAWFFVATSPAAAGSVGTLVILCLVAVSRASSCCCSQMRLGFQILDNAYLSVCKRV